MSKSVRPGASSFVRAGAEHQPQHVVAQAASVKRLAAKSGPQIGRPKGFEEEAGRLNLLLPVSLVKAIKQKALDTGKTPGQVVAEALGKNFGV